MSSLLLSTRDVIHDLMDKEGNLYPTPRARILRLNLDKEKIKFLLDYISFLMNTKVVCDVTKMYLLQTGSLPEIVREYNAGMPEEKQINSNTAQSKVYYDKNKLEKLFEQDMIQKLLHQNCDTTPYDKLLALAINRYTRKNKLLGNLVLKLPQNLFNETLSDQEFNEVFGIIAPYCKKQITFIQENLPTEGVGYINYLMSAQELKGVDKERFERLQLILQ